MFNNVTDCPHISVLSLIQFLLNDQFKWFFISSYSNDGWKFAIYIETMLIQQQLKVWSEDLNSYSTNKKKILSVYVAQFVQKFENEYASNYIGKYLAIEWFKVVSVTSKKRNIFISGSRHLLPNWKRKRKLYP